MPIRECAPLCPARAFAGKGRQGWARTNARMTLARSVSWRNRTAGRHRHNRRTQVVRSASAIWASDKTLLHTQARLPCSPESSASPTDTSLDVHPAVTLGAHCDQPLTGCSSPSLTRPRRRRTGPTRIRLAGGAPDDDARWRMVVGIVADTRRAGVEQPVRTESYHGRERRFPRQEARHPRGVAKLPARPTELGRGVVHVPR
jgi:hypothetical protein